MWKLLIILILLIYLLNKISVVLMRAFGRPQSPPPFPRGNPGDVNVNQDGKQSAKRGSIKGGEYVDYEEVK